MKAGDDILPGARAELLGAAVGGAGRHVTAEADRAVVLSDTLLYEGEYHRFGYDLVVAHGDERLTVHDYFRPGRRPDLETSGGAKLSADVVEAISHSAEGQRTAQATSPAAPQAIGRVETATGSATAIRNGVAVTLNAGDLVYRGDAVQTGAGSTLGITFLDGSAFSLSANARMVLNELVYAPGGTGNSALLSVVQGSISFLAGQVAKTGEMRVDTPVATMGIRGTLIKADVESNGSRGEFQVLRETDGTVGTFVLYNRNGDIIGTVSQTGVVRSVFGDGSTSVRNLSLAEQQQNDLVVQQVTQLYNLGQATPLVPGLPGQGPGPGGPGGAPGGAPGGGGSGGLGSPGAPNAQTLPPLASLFGGVVVGALGATPISFAAGFGTDQASIVAARGGSVTSTTSVSRTTEAAETVSTVDTPDDTPLPPATPTVPATSDQVVAISRGSTFDPATQLSVAGDTSIAGTFGTLVISPTGAYTFLATRAAPGGAPSTDTFTYQLGGTDGGAARFVTITVTVNGENDAPVAAAYALALAEDGTLGSSSTTVGSLLAGVEDPDLEAAGTAGPRIAEMTLAGGTTQSVAPAGDTVVAGRYGTLTVSADGRFSYAANRADALAAGQSATETFTYVVVDAGGARSVAAPLVFQLTGVNDAAIITGVITGEVPARTEGSGPPADIGQLFSTDVDGTANLFRPTSGTTVFGSYAVDRTGRWTYTLDEDDPAVLDLGPDASLTDTFDVLADDGTVQLVTITINGRDNRPPVETRPVTVAFSEDVGTVQRVNLLAGVTDPDGDALAVAGAPTLALELRVPAGSGTYTSGTYAENVAYTVDAAGTLSVDPAQFQSLREGERLVLRFGYAVTDGEASLPRTATVTVSGVNDPAIIGGVSTGAAAERVNQGTPITATGRLTSTDVDGTANLFRAATGTTAFASFTVSAGGLWTYTIDENSPVFRGLDTGASRADRFNVVADDGTVQVVTITINGRDNAAPVFESGTITVSFSEDDALQSVDLLARVSDPDNDPLAFNGNVAPTVTTELRIPAGSGTYTSGTYENTVTYTVDPATGRLTVDPAQFESLNEGELLTIRFGYAVTDGEASVARTATLTVSGTGEVNEAPSAANDFRSVAPGEDAVGTTRDGSPETAGVLANDTDPNPGDAAALTVVSARAGSGVPYQLTSVAQGYLTAGQALVNGLGGPVGFGENALIREDDHSSPAIDITSIFGANGVNFFDTRFNTLYVNNNGNLTFTAPSGDFTPDPIRGTGTNPIIAAFWYDVDTRPTAAQTVSPGGNSTGSNLVYWDLDVENHVFTATWDDVGYFSNGLGQPNAYQLQLIDRGSGDFDIIFRYEAINYASATGGSQGFDGARTGYSAGEVGNSDERPESGHAERMVTLDEVAGNTGRTGVDIYTVRNGEVSGPEVSLENGSATISGTYGVLELNDDGTYLYAANAGAQVGAVDRFTYTTTDPSGASATATLSFQITAPMLAGFAVEGPSAARAAGPAASHSRVAGMDDMEALLDGFAPGVPAAVTPPSSSPTSLEHAVASPTISPALASYLESLSDMAPTGHDGSLLQLTATPLPTTQAELVGHYQLAA